METPQIEVSKCCKAKPIYKARGVYVGNGWKVPHLCAQCRNGCEVIKVCEYCRGTGEVDEDETDASGNIARGVNTKKCICQLHEPEEADDQE